MASATHGEVGGALVVVAHVGDEATMGGERRVHLAGDDGTHVVVVDNQSGGGGTIACQATARAAPDGYTLMQGYVATHGTSPATRKLPCDAIKDFTPVGMIGGTPNVLVVNAALPVKTVPEFVAYLHANPGRANYGSAGQGRARSRT